MHPDGEMKNITFGSGTFYINNEPLGSIETLETFTTEDRCVCCGEIVPEGRMVCPMCENKPIIKCSSSCSFTVNMKVNKRTLYKLCGLKWYQVLWIELKNLLNKYFRWCKK